MKRISFARAVLSCSLLVSAALTTQITTSAAAQVPVEPTTQPLKLDLSLGQNAEYEGTIGDCLRIGMTLCFSRDGKTVAGCYFYDKYCTDIRIEGTIDGRTVLIHEFDPTGRETGLFVGEFPVSDPHHRFSSAADLQTEVITGSWAKPDGSKKRPFYLSETYCGTWQPGSRYSAAGFSDEHLVDATMARFRQAVLDGDSARAAAMIQFPITVRLEGKRIQIVDANAFRHHYDQIFLAGFVDRIRDSAPFHMFARDQGVMLGDGEIWIAPGRGERVDTPMVIAINNDIGEQISVARSGKR